MKLDRNINPDGRGKYALIKLRSADTAHINPHNCDGTFVVPVEAVDFGSTPDTEFFVIRLKDKYAYESLTMYSAQARADGHIEYSEEILELANRAKNHPCQKQPD